MNSKTSRRDCSSFSFVLEGETLLSPRGRHQSLQGSLVRNSQCSKDKIKLPVKSLPKISSPFDKIKKIIQNTESLTDLIEEMKRSNVAPIHSKPKTLNEIEYSDICVPNKQKVKLEPIMPSISPEKDFKKLLFVRNLSSNLDK